MYYRILDKIYIINGHNYIHTTYITPKNKYTYRKVLHYSKYYTISYYSY